MRFLDLIELLFNWLVTQSQRGSQGEGVDEEAALSGGLHTSWGLQSGLSLRPTPVHQGSRRAGRPAPVEGAAGIATGKPR